MDSIFKKENYSRFSLAIRIISAILVVAFFVQDVAWAHPDALQIELRTSQESFKLAYDVKCKVEKARRLTESTDINSLSLSPDGKSEILIDVDVEGKVVLRYCIQGREGNIPKGFISASYWGLDKVYTEERVVRQLLFSEKLHRELVSKIKTLPPGRSFSPQEDPSRRAPAVVSDFHKDTLASSDPVVIFVNLWLYMKHAGKLAAKALLYLWHNRTARLIAIYAFAFTTVCADTEINNFVEFIFIYACLGAAPFIAASLTISWVFDRIRGQKADGYAYYKELSKKSLHKVRLYVLLMIASFPGPLTREPMFEGLGFFDRQYFGSIGNGLGFDASIGDALSVTGAIFTVFTVWYITRYIRARRSMSAAAEDSGGKKGRMESSEGMSRAAEGAAKLKASRRAVLYPAISGVIIAAVFLGFNHIALNLADAGSLPLAWADDYKNIIHPLTWALVYLSVIFFNSAISRYMDYRRLRNEDNGGIENDPQPPPSAPPHIDPPSGAAIGGSETPPPIVLSGESEIPPPAPEPEPLSVKIDEFLLKASALGQAMPVTVTSDITAGATEGRTLILYSDDMLECGTAADLASALKEPDILNNSTIVLYGRDADKMNLLETLIISSSKGKNIEVKKISPEYFGGLNGGRDINVTIEICDEARELGLLLRYAKGSHEIGIKNGSLLGVIKGRYRKEFETTLEIEANKYDTPVVAFEHLEQNDIGKEIYSFKEALAVLIKIKNSGSPLDVRKWFKLLRPIEMFNIENMYKDYKLALEAAIRA